jgi:ABC-type proline/glycine betaine transport system substrate-binding protein
MKKSFCYILAAGLLLFSCKNKETVTLGTLNAPYDTAVGALYTEALEKAGYNVVLRRFDSLASLHAAVLRRTVEARG